jgi:cytochrome c-type biogenesis protein CcmH/NrfG
VTAAAAPPADTVDVSDPAAAHFFSAPPVTYDEEPGGPVEADPPPATRRPVSPERRRRLGRVVAGTIALSCAICVAAGVRVATVRAATTRVDSASELAHAPPPPAQIVAAGSLAPQTPQPDPVSDTLPAVEPAPASEAPAVAAPSAAPAVEPAASAAPAVEPAASAAQADSEKAPVELDPAAARDAKRISQRALDRGDAKGSIEAGERSVELDPTDAEAWLILGAAYQTRGTYPEARRCFASCVHLAKRGPRGECAALLR